MGANAMSFYINYNQIAKDYATFRNASQRAVSHISETVKSKDCGKILEIGCGTADHIYEINKVLMTDAYGFDGSSEMIREASQKNPGIKLCVSDINNEFPYSNNYLDFAYSINVIHYINDLKHYFDESYRIFKINGIISTIIIKIYKNSKL